MEKFSKKEIFKTPDNYFDGLQETIVSRYEGEKVRQISLFKRYAAAAIVVLGFAVYFINQTSEPNFTAFSGLQQEIDVYINSDYWQAEDILMLAENPNSILDEIIRNEWSDYDWELDDLENNIWY
ncbi:hypothetical protein [Cecembia sp.]|uniref:hypothetical protein n=1 Tax=Cecembia sp. TaxID=1898110 RepID=UPI0025BA72FA|nr:hypothetical protein [Cecembia sp.]